MTESPIPTPEALQESSLQSLPLFHKGKVRDSYAVGTDYLLIVATDRLSAFDVILPTPVPSKGRILTDISNFWFEKTAHIVANHLTGIAVEDVVSDPHERAQVKGRSVVVKRLKPLPAEAVVRGYLIGSGWKDYQRTGAVCGIGLPANLSLAQKLPAPIFTPATKAAVGDHDENISFETLVELLGKDHADQLKTLSHEIYTFAAQYAVRKGILIADTKFEFGLDANDNIVLMDEVLTPDSSRFWPISCYAEGTSPPSYDKQYVRDYLEMLDWNKTAPGPAIPDNVLKKTADKYREVRDVLLA